MFPSILQAPSGGQLSGIVGMDGYLLISTILTATNQSFLLSPQINPSLREHLSSSRLSHFSICTSCGHLCNQSIPEYLDSVNDIFYSLAVGITTQESSQVKHTPAQVTGKKLTSQLYYDMRRNFGLSSSC